MSGDAAGSIKFLLHHACKGGDKHKDAGVASALALHYLQDLETVHRVYLVDAMIYVMVFA